MAVPSAVRLLRELGRRGIRLRVDGSGLRYWPTATVDEDRALLGEIKALKSGLIELVSDRDQALNDPPRRPSDQRLAQWLAYSAPVLVGDRPVYLRGRLVPNPRDFVTELRSTLEQGLTRVPGPLEDLALLWEIFVWMRVRFGGRRPVVAGGDKRRSLPGIAPKLALRGVAKPSTKGGQHVGREVGA